MLMTRILFLAMSALMLVLDAAALWSISGAKESVGSVVPTALIVNAIALPAVMVMAYRIGQITGVAHFRKGAKGKDGGPRAHHGAG